MLRIGIAQRDITPQTSVWLTGYGNRDHRSEGVYQALRASALYLQGDRDTALILTADLIGYSSAFAAAAKLQISEATGLLPRQIVLTATHTHCAPFFTPWIMPGQLEPEYAALVLGQLPAACPQEIQILQLTPELRLVFLGGEVLSQIGLHLKAALQPATTVVAAYSNGLIGYVPNEDTYNLGGYEVNGSHYYFLRPAPFAKDVEARIMAQTTALVQAPELAAVPR